MYSQSVKGTVGSFPINVSPGPGQKAGSVFEMHYHDEAEMLLITNGEMICSALNERIFLSKGDIIFFNSRTPHSTYVQKDGTSSTLLQYDIDRMYDDKSLYNHKYLSLFLNNSSGSYAAIRKGTPLCNEITTLINEIVIESLDSKKGYELYIKSHVLSILGALSRSGILEPAESVNMVALKKIYPALNYIDQNYNTPITLKDLGKITNISPYYFCRLFKNATNSTFINYMNFVRMSEAEKLLVDTEWSITEISSAVGFSDATYFNRLFKRQKACTPSKYRKLPDRSAHSI